MEKDAKRRLAAILSADVKDYSLLMRDDERATIRTITAYREIMASLVQQHHGRVVDSPGDNILAEFASVVDAVQASAAIQKELKVQNTELPENRKMEFRIGVNLGDIIVEGDRIYGDGVNIAARLESLADPGGICISRTAHDQIEDKLPLGYEYLGEKHVKNTPKPIRAYRVLLEPEDAKARGKKVTLGPQEDQKPGEEFVAGDDSLRERSKEFSSPSSSRKRLLAAILSFFFGVFGAHRFYAGKTGSGLVQIFTIGGLGIWCFIDFLIILFGEFSDVEGKKIRDWT